MTTASAVPARRPGTPPLTESYVRGADHPPLLRDTIGRAFDRAAERWPDREAVVSCHQGVRLSYRELKERVDAYAAGFLALGLNPGDRVGIWSHNNWEWLVTQLATAKAGLVLVNINPAYRRAELEYALNKVACKALVTMPAFKSSDYLQMLRDLAPELDFCRPGELASEILPQLKAVVRLGEQHSVGMLNFTHLPVLATGKHRDRLEVIAGAVAPGEAINIQFTSGTTGLPKGATLTHRNILNNGYFVGETLRLTEDDRVCVPVPLYHCFGMVLGNLAALTHGACIVYPDQSFNPEAVLKAVAAERCTVLHGVPTMFIALLNHPDFAACDVTSLRTGIMAGAPCPIEVMRQVVTDLHMPEVTIAYGMTETSPVSFQSAVDEPLERRVSTVGRILPHLEVKLVDPEGAIVPPGTAGELCTKGYSVMLGYWGDEAKSRDAIDPGGWMHSGDLATLDTEGYCNIVGRIKDMIIRGGENIYPREIEEYLFRHPAIEDVQVVGVPDAKYGEELCAWIMVKEGHSLTEDAVRAFCQGQIAHYKIPRYIRFVQGFPMTVTGKVQKFAIRRAMVEELGLAEARTA